MRSRLRFLLLNIAHFFDHLFMLIFATLAALVLTGQWQVSYAQLILYATPGFVAFGAFAVPAGWLADRWSRDGMIVVFFIGIGLSACLCALASTPLQMSAGLFFVGVFAAIYHPVGIALVLGSRRRNGLLVAINGVWGNMGVACAALLTAYFIQSTGWRSAFVIPGLLSVALGVVYFFLLAEPVSESKTIDTSDTKNAEARRTQIDRSVLTRVLVVVFITTALGGLVFQSTTFALPKVMAERVSSDISDNVSIIGQLAFVAFFAGSVGQLVVGFLLDRVSIRRIFMTVAAFQVVFFSVAVSATDELAVAAAIGYMLAAFGQIPINDVLIGRAAQPEYRSRILGIRYTITILVMAGAIPFIAAVHQNYGFELLFKILAIASSLIFFVVITLPGYKALNGIQPSAA